MSNTANRKRPILVKFFVDKNKVADNMNQRSELDYLVYNDPLAYANLVLKG